MQTALGKELHNPEVSIELTKVHPLFAYAVGNVTQPGQYPFTAGARISELLAQAHDVLGARDQLTASLIRGAVTLPVDLNAVVAGTPPEANLPLQDGDILVIAEPFHIMVRVAGQVHAPGNYHLPDKSILIEALLAAGDIAEPSQHITITLVRNGKASILARSDRLQPLQDGDLILVEPEPMIRVFVNGEVAHPGMYDAPADSGVLQAITLAGGVGSNPALSQVSIVRLDGTYLQVNLVPALVHGDVTQNPRLSPGDVIIVPVSRGKVTVLGAVITPGVYAISDAHVVTAMDAISLAGGYAKSAKLSEVGIIRTTNGKTQRISVNLNEVLKHGKEDKNIPVQPDDIVYVPESNGLSWDSIMSSLSSPGQRHRTIRIIRVRISPLWWCTTVRDFTRTDSGVKIPFLPSLISTRL